MDNQDVIAPLDMNPQTNYNVLEKAVEYSNEDSTIHVVSVEVSEEEGDFREEVLDDAEEIFEEIETGDREMDRIKETDQHKPAMAISDYAEDIGADLVVMYTSGREGLERVILGSTTGKTINNCPCPVLALSQTE